MKRITKLAATALASATMFAATPVTAQPSDLDPAAVAAAVRYSLPMAFDGYMTRCFDSLAPDGYAITNADALRAKFADGNEASWPGAKALMMDMAREEAGDMTAVFELMDDDDLRPFVDGLITNMAASEIREQDCETIERGLEIFDPLPADNLAMMVGFIVELGIAMDQEEMAQAEAAADAAAAEAADMVEPEMTESRRRKLREQEEERRQ